MALPTYTLTLLRHAKSEWGLEGLTDKQRPLNRRGERDAPEMGRRLKAAGVRPSLIVCSAAQRTVQTARLFAGAIGFPEEFIHRESALYLASAAGILDLIEQQESTFQNLVVVGHNPGISELAETLSDGLTTHMPTAAMLTLQAETDDWQGFRHAAIRIVGYDYPKNAAGPITRF
ncbi:MAG: histidine phosphatase family protein [Pseudomonadota bacterium]